MSADRWLASHFQPWRGRTVDTAKLVKVHRCLASGRGRYSIHQGGRVVGHADVVMLTGAAFVVSAAGYRRCLRLGRKVVYAYVSGVLADSVMGVGLDSPDSVRIGATARLFGGAFRAGAGGDAFASARAVGLRQDMQVAYATMAAPQAARWMAVRCVHEGHPHTSCVWPVPSSSERLPEPSMPRPPDGPCVAFRVSR